MTGAKVEVLTRKDLRDLSVVSGGLEIIDWVLYDTVILDQAAPQVSFRFFQQAVGQPGITLERTNMEIPGQLPAGYKMVAQKLVVVAKPITTAGLYDITAVRLGDQINVSHTGRAQFFIGTRPYLQVPLQNLLGGMLQGFAATTAAEGFYAQSRTVVNGEMEYAPVVPANYSFSLAVDYDVFPTISSVQKVLLQAQMIGKLVRPRQG